MTIVDEKSKLLDNKVAHLLIDVRGDITSIYERCIECFLDDKNFSSKFKCGKKYWINAIRSAGQVAKNRDHYGKIISLTDKIEFTIIPINKVVNKVLYLSTIIVLFLDLLLLWLPNSYPVYRNCSRSCL